MAIANPVAGQIARVRQRLYLVDRVHAATAASDSILVDLSCVDDDAQGQPLQVLWDREIDREVLTGEAWDAIAKRGFDQPKLFSAYLNTLKWNCVTSTDPRLFQSPFRAGIRLDAYQLEPLRKALRLPRVNLFIADDVGLGKTIEAGLIARELLLRKKAKEIVVCCPPSMLLQWKDELETRFGLTFEILDKDYMKRVRQDRGFGVNPWTTHSRFLISNRLLIDEAYAGPLRDWLGDFRGGTLFILDEAHHGVPASRKTGPKNLKTRSKCEGWVSYTTDNGWNLLVFNDAGYWDYLELAEDPKGNKLDFDDLYAEPEIESPKSDDLWGILPYWESDPDFPLETTESD